LKLSLGWLTAGSLSGPAAAEGIDRALVLARDRGFPGLDQEHEGRWRGSFFFLQLADTQFGMFSDNADFAKETELVTHAVQHINRLKPKFVIVCGDLVNSGPGGKTHPEQAREFKRLMGQVDPSIPLVCVCGNHDVGNRPTPGLLSAYRKEFGDTHFGFWVGGVRCLALNSSLYYDPTGAPQEFESQDQWFRAELSAAKQSGAPHILVFQHHPWFLKDADEPDQYFNIPQTRRAPALRALQEAGVRAVLAGHYHRNAYGKHGDMEMITTSAVGKPLGKDPSGFRVVKVYRQRIEHRYYGLEDVPQVVKLDETGK
jgi:3',5'-cyclic AMP phosphodiesterase CpdA